MSVRIRSLERAKDQVVQRQSHLRIWYSGSPNFHAVSIDVHRFIGTADDHGDGTGGRLIWIPVELAGRDRLALLASLRKEKTGMHSCPRRGVCVRDDNRRAFHSNTEEQFGKFQRKPDTSMRIRITRQVTGMERYAAPGHPFHVRHLCALVDTRGMMHLFFQDRENAGGSRVTGSSSADTRPRDANTVAIYIRHLFGTAGHDQKWSFGRALRFPNILAGLQANRFRGDSD